MSSPNLPTGYRDALETHGLRGTAIPRADPSAQVGAPVRYDSHNSNVDVMAPIEQNIVIGDPASQTSTVVKMDIKALERLKRANTMVTKGQRAVSYEEAAAMPEDKPAEEPVVDDLFPNDKKAAEIIKKWKKEKFLKKQVAKDAPPPADDEFILNYYREQASKAAPPPEPKIKVKFSGAFGKLTVPYSRVHIHGIYLILTQIDSSSAFFEAPEGDQRIEVDIQGKVLLCYPGPQFPLSESNTTFITVYLIDEAATEEFNAQKE